MSIAHEPVEIRASNGTLWIGNDAYRLHAITRATATERPPDRRAAVQRYAIPVASWLFLATLTSAVTPAAVSALVTIAALTWFTAKTVNLFRSLKTTEYELAIETRAGTHRILVNTNPKAISDIAFRITDAINNPALEFHIRTEGIRPTGTRSSPQGEQPRRINLT